MILVKDLEGLVIHLEFFLTEGSRFHSFLFGIKKENNIRVSILFLIL